MEFNLHPKLASFIDREGDRLASLVEDVTEKLSLIGGSASPYEWPVKKFINPQDIIGEIVASSSDLAGNLIARFYPHQGRILGLVKNAMEDAQKVAERIWDRPEIRDFVSRTTILESLLDYVGSKTRGMITESLSLIIEKIFLNDVQKIVVWVPLYEIFIFREFTFGTAIISPITKIKIDDMLKIAGSKLKAKHAENIRASLYTEWAGRTAMCFDLQAEPRRAREIANERADNYMSLLQFYTTPTKVLSLVSHAAPRGARPYREQECIVCGLGTFDRAKGLAEPTYHLVIDADFQMYMEKFGLIILSDLAQRTSCDYEESLYRSLLIYGRACYHFDPNDKMLQIMTAVEMFLLKNDNEPIQAALADRMAFAISNEPGIRQKIAQNLRGAYSIRSGRTHHGKSIANTEVIEQFLRNAWAFFLTAIRNVGCYKTRVEFLDYLDSTKYGHGQLSSTV